MGDITVKASTFSAYGVVLLLHGEPFSSLFGEALIRMVDRMLLGALCSLHKSSLLFPKTEYCFTRRVGGVVRFGDCTRL